MSERAPDDDEQDPFERAHAAVDARDLDGLRALLDRFPQVVGERGGINRNDLLGMATATCDERLVALLLERGADPATANVHGWTALHQAAYVGLPALAQLLLDADDAAAREPRGEAGTDAPRDTPLIEREARGEGGTALVVALFWGHAPTAELLAARSLAPGNLRVAAGLGRLDRIEQVLPARGDTATPGHGQATAADPPLPTRGAPTAAAGAARAFYRPHSGFPVWTPSSDPAEIVDEALAWAARNDRAEALDLLVARGAQVDADVYRGSALAWAAAQGRGNAIRELLTLGADPNARTSFGGSDHGEGATALHLAAQSGRLEAIGLLLDAGADPALRDARHGATPAGWAEHAGRQDALALLRAVG